MKFQLAPRQPERLEELDETRRLLVWCLRRWIVGHCRGQSGTCRMVWNELAGRLGAARARAALRGLTRLVCALGNHARRPIRYHQPCCGCLTGDEYHVATLVMALGAGDLLRARGLAEWLVGPEGVVDLLAAGIGMAEAFRDRQQPGAVAAPDRGSQARVGAAAEGGGCRRLGDGTSAAIDDAP